MIKLKEKIIDIVFEMIISAFLGVGLVFLASPLFLFWFIHSSRARYLWIINGPYPFSHFGGGPYQMAMGLVLILAGIFLITCSIVLRKLILK